MINEYKFSVNITTDDLYKFNTFHLKMRPFQIYFIILGIVFFILVAINSLLQGKVFLLFMTFLILTSIIFLFSILYIFIIKLSVKKAHTTNSFYREQINYEFNNNSIYAFSESFKSITKWEQVYRISESNYAFYIYLSSQMALVLPKRYFDDKVKISDFRKFINNTCKDKVDAKNVRLKNK